jgi:ABC-type sugar transport system ATPase subunit
MIKIEGLKKSYAGRPVLQGIDLSVKAGEFLVVLGPSGAGKSTLLRCINGLAQPDAGRTVIDGKVLDLRRGAAGKRPVAMIFQHHNLVKRLSVLKNVLVGRMAGSMSSLPRRCCSSSRRSDVAIAMRLPRPGRARPEGEFARRHSSPAASSSVSASPGRWRSSRQGDPLRRAGGEPRSQDLAHRARTTCGRRSARRRASR